MEEINENTYKDVINSALKDVLHEVMIQHDGEKYLVFIQDIQYHDGKVIIDWSTPHEEHKEMLYPHVENLVKVMIGEIKPSRWERFCSFFRRG